MMTKSNHYIGITGVADKTELASLVESCADISVPKGYHVAVGVLLSDHTFHGGEPRIARYPKMPTAFEILASIPAPWKPIIHYNSTSTAPLSEQVAELFEHEALYARGTCRAIQLNVKSPCPGELQSIRRLFPELHIVLQVPMWREDLATTEGLGAFIDPYVETATHLLFDPSGGRGAELEDERIRLITSVLPQIPDNVGIAVAGGFSKDNVSARCAQVHALLRLPFSIDAEGKLRGGRCDGSKVGDRMNPEKVQNYLFEAATAIAALGVGEETITSR